MGIFLTPKPAKRATLVYTFIFIILNFLLLFIIATFSCWNYILFLFYFQFHPVLIQCAQCRSSAGLKKIFALDSNFVFPAILEVKLITTLYNSISVLIVQVFLENSLKIIITGGLTTFSTLSMFSGSLVEKHLY